MVRRWESVGRAAGVYAPIGETITLKSGIGTGQDKDEGNRWADTLRANVTLMYRF